VTGVRYSMLAAICCHLDFELGDLLRYEGSEQDLDSPAAG
jgi:DNA-binding Xre family transcriptional regulator